MASLALAILIFAVPVSPAQAQASDPAVIADLVIQVQELQDEVRALVGRMEEQERELASLRQRQRDQYLDLDQRINEARTGTGAGAVAGPEAAATGPVPATRPGAAEPVAPAAADVPEVRAPMDTPSETVGIGQPDARSAEGAAPSGDEKADYDHAFQALKELRYADAADEFRAFLQRYPGSEWAGNAQYWLGESYYVTRNYEIALTAFQDLMRKYPDSTKVPDALLKIGYTHYELKQYEQARAALIQVTQDYPNTTLARLADSRLRTLRVEGHY